MADEDAEEKDKSPETPSPSSEDNNNSIRTANNNNNNNNNDLPPTLAALTAACGEKLLNPNFLTGGEVQPFTTDVQKKNSEEGEKNEITDVKQEVIATPLVVEVVKKEDYEEPKRPEIKLYSHKMKGLKNLLLAEKLNTQAILLQMTAQSQVGAGKKSSRGWNANEQTGKDNEGSGGTVAGGGNTGSGVTGDEQVTSSGRPKRARRE